MSYFSILIWRDITKYKEEERFVENVLLKCPVYGVYEGWLGDDGWHSSACADHLDFPIDPQPLEYAKIPK